MRAIKSLFVVSVAIVLFTAAPSFALLPNVTYFDFSGWNHAQIVGGGQTFTVAPGLDVTVTAVGDFSVDSKFSGGFIKSGELMANEMNEFRFNFSKSIPVVVKTNSVDRFEDFRIYGIGSETYFHDRGSAPTESVSGTGLKLVGTGVGLDPTDGAARGETVTAAQAGAATLRFQHRSLANNKFEQIMVGTFVPEPNCLTLVGLCLAGLGVFRKRG